MNVNNSVLAGCGIGVTTIQLAPGSAGVTGVVRTPSGVQNSKITFQDFTIDGNKANQTGSPTIIGFYCGVTPDSTQTDTDIACLHVEAMNCTDYGFDPQERSTRTLFIGCVSHDNLVDGFTFGANYDGTIVGCVSYNNGGHGFNLVTASNRMHLSSNEAYGNTGNGFTLQQGAKNCVLAGNLSYSNSGDGILINGVPQTGSQQDLTAGMNNVLSGNSIFSNGNHGIHLIGATGNLIVGNKVRDSGQATTNTYNQIYLDETGTNYSTNNVIAENFLDITPGGSVLPKYGIQEASSNDNGNTYHGNVIPSGCYGTAAQSVLAALAAYSWDAPSIHGFIDWNYPPQQIASTTSAITGGTVYFIAIRPQVNGTITNINLYLGTVGSGLTAGDSRVGLYSISGGVATLLSGSADQSTAWSTAGNVNKVSTVALTTSQSVVAGEVYYVGIIAAGTTGPSFGRGPSSTGIASNVGLSTTSPYMFATYTTTGQTALPPSVTLSSGTTSTGSIQIFVATS